MKKNSGITLIALVVTIVVLLILAGISITVLFGKNGFITQAQYAAFLTEMSQVEEKVEIKKASVIGNQLLNQQGVLFEETLGERTDIKIPNTLKQEVMYIREGKPADKKTSDYDVQNFDPNRYFCN